MRIFGNILAILVIIAFFMPWAEPVKRDPAPLEKSSNWVEGWVSIRKDAFNTMIHDPGLGMSGFQIISARSKSYLSKKREKILQPLAGDHAPGIFLYCALIPVLCCLATFFLTMRNLPKFWVYIIAFCEVLTYFLARWMLIQNPLWDLELQLGLGFWLSLYGCFLMGMWTIFYSFEL
jgi:hypothetical protein